jgi:lipopolysaccharide transport system permease protein
MIGSFREIFDYREFVREYTMQVLRSRYRGSVLGFFWTLLNPVLLCITYIVVFTVVMHVNVHQFIPYFLGSYIPWLFFVNAGSSATFAIIGNAHYVSRTYVPKGSFPIANVLINLVDFVISLAFVALLLAAIAPERITPALLFLPISTLILIMFVTGVSYLFATLNVFFRDFSFVWTSVSTMWFFFSPILYRMDQITPAMRPVFGANIIVPFLKLFQDPIAYGVVPSMETVLSASLCAAIVFILGASAFFRSEKQFYMYV